MRNLAQYRQYVYDYLDLDREDVAEGLIDTWVKDGFGRIIRSNRPAQDLGKKAAPRASAEVRG